VDATVTYQTYGTREGSEDEIELVEQRSVLDNQASSKERSLESGRVVP
jgi:hypothetical protein